MTTQQVGAPRELLADRAYVQLRDLIITLRIRPGDPIDVEIPPEPHTPLDRV